jgi:hypothetical protein
MRRLNRLEIIAFWLVVVVSGGLVALFIDAMP